MSSTDTPEPDQTTQSDTFLFATSDPGLLKAQHLAMAPHLGTAIDSALKRWGQTDDDPAMLVACMLLMPHLVFTELLARCGQITRADMAGRVPPGVPAILMQARAETGGDYVLGTQILSALGKVLVFLGEADEPEEALYRTACELTAQLPGEAYSEVAMTLVDFLHTASEDRSGVLVLDPDGEAPANEKRAWYMLREQRRQARESAGKDEQG